MTLATRIENERRTYRAMTNNAEVVEYMANPSCEWCKGAGTYFMTTEQWYAAVKTEVERTGGVIAPIGYFRDFKPKGIDVMCMCVTTEQHRIAMNMTAKIERMEKTMKWIEGALGSEYVKKDYDGYNWTIYKHKEIFTSWMKVPKSMYIHGLPHKGKTHLLSVAAQHVAVQNVIVILYADIMTLASDMSNMTARSQFIDNLCFADWLMIDDIGTGGRLTPERFNVLKTIMDFRVGNKKPTIVTSEHAPDKIFAGSEMNIDNLRWRFANESIILDLDK